jgi:hypothetical protein
MGYLEDRRNRKNGLAPPLPTKKPPKAIPKKSAKKAAEDKANKERGGDSEMDLFRGYHESFSFNLSIVAFLNP